jgi:Ca2+-binding EF-hand superfamily protein
MYVYIARVSSGSIDKDELGQAMIRMGKQMTELQLDEMIMRCVHGVTIYIYIYIYIYNYK